MCKERLSQVQLKRSSIGQKSAKLNCCDSKSDDEIMRADNHVTDTPVNADEVSAFENNIELRLFFSQHPQENA